MKGIGSIIGHQEDIIETIPSTILVVNSELEILYANRNYYNKSVTRRNDIIGERISRVFPKMLIEKTNILDKIREVFQTGIPFDGDQIRYPGGMFYFYRIHPLKSSGDVIDRAVIFMEDVTKLIKLEEELRDSYIKLENAYEELKESDEIKSEFISTASHELRTPLTVICSYIEMFGEGLLGELSDVQREKIEVIYSQTDHMIRLVEDMLETLRLESKKFKIQKSSISLEEIASAVIADLSRLAGLKEHSILLDARSSNSKVKGDKRRIRQVFNNLLTNAIKYTPKKGHIKILIEEEPLNMRVSIQDDGMGIPDEDCERIFQKFYTGGGRALGKGSGQIGLGLAIAKSIVEAHEGKIWVESEPDVGSTFIFTLPKYD